MISKEEIAKFIPILRQEQTSSNCQRARVACALFDSQGLLLALASNGSQYPHYCQRPREMGNCGCMHAEVRAALKLRNNPFYAIVSRAPCEHCAKVLAEVGIREVYYLEPSRPQEQGFKVFCEADIKYGLLWENGQRIPA